MAIKYNWRDLVKRIINGREVEKVMYNGSQIWPNAVPPIPNYLCFTSAVSRACQIALDKNGNPNVVSLEISNDGNTWRDYTLGDWILLENIWDKVYFRNKSESQVRLSSSRNDYYYFRIPDNCYVSWDITTLLCKTWTTTVNDYEFFSLFSETEILSAPELPATTLAEGCYSNMFMACYSLTTAPSLPATTLAGGCYYEMFMACRSLTTLPQLPATTLTNYCYYYMFYSCDNIKLSNRQIDEYQTPYRIPTSGTWTNWSGSLEDMFELTWWRFYWTPTINTTYYTSNTVI